MNSQDKQQVVAQVEAVLREIGALSFSGEAQLLEWSKSTSRDGPKVKLLLPDDEAVVPFETATIRKGKQAGQLYHIFAIRLDEEEGFTAPPAKPAEGPAGAQPTAKGESGQPNMLANKLHVEGYFRNPHLWVAMHDAGIYSLQEHKRWVETQPCAYAKREGDACFGDVCAHHCKSAAGLVGGRRQPEAPQKVLHGYCLPLCHGHHTLFAHNDADAEDKEQMLSWAVGLMADRVKGAMKKHIGIASLREITPEALAMFELGIGFSTKGGWQ